MWGTYSGQNHLRHLLRSPRGVYCFVYHVNLRNELSLRLRCGSDAWYEGSVVIIDSQDTSNVQRLLNKHVTLFPFERPPNHGRIPCGCDLLRIYRLNSNDCACAPIPCNSISQVSPDIYYLSTHVIVDTSMNIKRRVRALVTKGFDSSYNGRTFSVHHTPHLPHRNHASGSHRVTRA